MIDSVKNNMKTQISNTTKPKINPKIQIQRKLFKCAYFGFLILDLFGNICGIWILKL